MNGGVLAFAMAWRFLAADAPQVVAMEWTRVLNSPMSAEMRREIPSEAMPALSGINFIEGIDRLIWTPRLMILEGSFDVDRLKEMAAADGGVATKHREMDLIVPPEKDGSVLAVSASVVLLGAADLVRAALDRARNRKAFPPEASDLWIRTTTADSSSRHDFRLQLGGDTIRISSELRYATEGTAQLAAENAAAFQLTAAVRGTQVFVAGTKTPEEFRKRS